MLDKEEQVRHLFYNTESTIEELCSEAGISVKEWYSKYRKLFPSEDLKKRKSLNYCKSKLGDKNPMLGRCRTLHPRYKGIVSDNKSYFLILKPSWYTGRPKSKHIFYHHKVVCENLGITEVPSGYNVHHCNFDRADNRFENLVMLTSSEHKKLHMKLKGATTISKESTLKWVEAHRQGKEYSFV